MTTYLVPTLPDDPFYTQTSNLDGVDYTLVFRYAQRENRWYLTIEDANETPLLKGIKLVPFVDLLGARRNETRLPLGRLFVAAPPLSPEAPGLGELGEGRRCQLYYDSPVDE